MTESQQHYAAGTGGIVEQRHLERLAQPTVPCAHCGKETIRLYHTYRSGSAGHRDSEDCYFTQCPNGHESHVSDCDNGAYEGIPSALWR